MSEYEKGKHPKQREYDALLILYWRRNAKFGQLGAHCKELLGKYPDELGKEGLIRCSAFCRPDTHVRVWVDTFLHPLSVKLWDIEDNKRILDWVNASTGLDCEVDDKARKWQREGRNLLGYANRKQQAAKITWSKTIGETLRGRNINQVKATGRGAKARRAK